MTINEESQKMVKEAVGKLLEHFDSVQIFVTHHNGDSDQTEAFESGGGNFFARMGQIHEWVSIQDQYQREWASDHKSQD